MKEDLLHFIWKYKKLQLVDMRTSKNESVSIIEVGTHNELAGPDFFNAKISIAGQLWAGNVEIHLKSSDWYAHHHEGDSNYDNVILHVVWDDDGEVFRKDNTEIPTLELKKFISQGVLNAYRNLFDKKGVNFINCEKDIGQIVTFNWQNWLERLYFERLERKSDLIHNLLKTSKNDWESVLFSLLLKNFGLQINGDAFLGLSKTIDFSIIRKVRSDTLQLESVFFGMSHLLDGNDVFDEYYIRLKREYVHLKHKFDLRPESVQKPEFFKLRPPNFPTIRLSQLANLYAQRSSLFSEVIGAKSLKELYWVFNVSAGPYWNSHFTFGKESKKSTKRLSKKFIDLLIINSVLPLKFCYAKYSGKRVGEELMDIVAQIKREDNSIVKNFGLQGVPIKNAMESQAVLQLYNNYCTKNKCLQCAVGSSLMRG